MDLEQARNLRQNPLFEEFLKILDADVEALKEDMVNIKDVDVNALKIKVLTIRQVKNRLDNIIEELEEESARSGV